MPRSKEMSSSLRNQAVGLSKAGTSCRKISNILGINYSTVYYILKKFKETVSTINITRAGRPKSISLRASRHLKSIVKSNRRTGLRGITQLFNLSRDLPVSQKTVSRNIHNLGFHARRACKKPLISPKNRIKRLGYYKRHRLWTVNDWKNVVFSDESKFNLFHSDGRVKIWRQPHERYHPGCTTKTVQGFGGSLMFWGCITYQKLGPLIEVQNTLNSNIYISTILEPFLRFWKILRRKVFMQDNAPCHTSKVVEAWFGLKKVKKLLWPPQSPDLNPIENVWEILFRRMRENKQQPRSLVELREGIKEEWRKFPIDIIQKLYQGLPGRVEELKKNERSPYKILERPELYLIMLILNSSNGLLIRLCGVDHIYAQKL